MTEQWPQRARVLRSQLGARMRLAPTLPAMGRAEALCLGKRFCVSHLYPGLSTDGGQALSNVLESFPPPHLGARSAWPPLQNNPAFSSNALRARPCPAAACFGANPSMRFCVLSQQNKKAKQTDGRWASIHQAIPTGLAGPPGRAVAVALPRPRCYYLRISQTPSSQVLVGPLHPPSC